MKTLAILTTAVLIMISGLVQASAPSRTLSFRDAMGRTLTMPVKVEQPFEEDFPFDDEAVRKEFRLERAYAQIDLRPITKPEPEADDIPESLRHLIR